MDQYSYGSRAWIDTQYAKSTDDPWGLTWRGSQLYRYGRTLAALQSQLPPLPSRHGALTLLDIGCATGTFTEMLASLNAPGTGHVVGIDISALAIARARTRYPALAFECMALDAASRRHAGSADVVACMEVLYYLAPREREQAIRQLRGMLKPGGLLVVSSMVARAPYLNASELEALIGSQMHIEERGELYLKPLATYEKLMMKMRFPVAARLQAGQVSAVARLGAALPTLTRSHAYVVARNA